MDERDFNAFKKSIEHEREFEFDESGWADLKGRMDVTENRKRRPLLGWWMLAAAAVMLPLVVGNVFLFSNLRETQKINEQMQSKLEAFSKTERDTVWQERIVYVHDTLLDENMVYRNIPVVPKKYRQLKSVLTDKDLETLLAGKLPDRLRDLPGETPPATVEDLANAALQNVENQAVIPDLSHVPDLLESKDLTLLKSKHPSNLDLDALLPMAKIEEKETPFLVKIERAVRPKGLTVGASLGGLLPISKELTQPSGWSAGIGTEVIFSRNLRLRLDASYARISFTSNEMNLGLGIPEVPSPGDDYVFNDARVAQNALHFNLGMKYLWNTKNKLQPFVYAGYGTTYILPYTVYYDYENVNLPVPEVTVPLETSNTLLISGFGMAGLGLSYAFNDHFSFSVEGSYRKQFSKSSLSNPDLAGLRTGLTYQF